MKGAHLFLSAVAALAAAGPALAAGSLVQQSQRQHCEAQWQALQQKPGMGSQDASSFLKTCMADTNGAAALPGPRLTMHAPAGATGVCHDGSYTNAVKGAHACAGHGGLSHWMS